MRILLILAALLSATCFAQTPIINGEGTVTLSWMAPTEYIDGSPIPAGGLTGYEIFYGEQSRFDAGGTAFRPGCGAAPIGPGDVTCYAATVNVGGGATSEPVTIQLTEDTQIFFALTATAFNNLWSNYSNETDAQFILDITDNRVPGAPVIIDMTFTITCTTDTPNVTCEFTVQ